MLRLLLALVCGLTLAGTLLLMRQQRLELQHQCNAIHDQMLETQTQLWRQQVQIAAAVAPGALKEVLANHELRTAPAGEAQSSGWEDVMPSSAGTSDWSLLQ